MLRRVPLGVVEWHIAFIGGVRVSWWQWPLHREFRHLFAFGYDVDARVWLLFEYAFEGIRLRVLSADQLDWLVAAVVQSGGRILRTRRRPGRLPRRPRLVFTCVTAMAHLLGYRFGAFSVRGFYRRLLRDGALPAFTTVTHGLDVRRRQAEAGS